MNSQRRLQEIYLQIPHTICPRGCGKCCGPVFPSLAEIENIKKYCARNGIEYREFYCEDDADQFGLDCPYLNAEHICLIYPVRPFLCRILGASDLVCPLGLCRPYAKVLNHIQTEHLYRRIYMKGKDRARTIKHKQILADLFKKGAFH